MLNTPIRKCQLACLQTYLLWSSRVKFPDLFPVSSLKILKTSHRLKCPHLVSQRLKMLDLRHSTQKLFSQALLGKELLRFSMKWVVTSPEWELAISIFMKTKWWSGNPLQWFLIQPWWQDQFKLPWSRLPHSHCISHKSKRSPRSKASHRISTKWWER